jgi:hypothetical protein
MKPTAAEEESQSGAAARTVVVAPTVGPASGLVNGRVSAVDDHDLNRPRRQPRAPLRYPTTHTPPTSHPGWTDKRGPVTALFPRRACRARTSDLQRAGRASLPPFDASRPADC